MTMNRIQLIEELRKRTSKRTLDDAVRQSTAELRGLYARLFSSAEDRDNRPPALPQLRHSDGCPIRPMTPVEKRLAAELETFFIEEDVKDTMQEIALQCIRAKRPTHIVRLDPRRSRMFARNGYGFPSGLRRKD
jgi:hypothetical protein